MALTLKKESVKRGRVEDNFADATASMEPAPTAADMGVMAESVRTQQMLQAKLMSKNVVVELEEPYLGDPHATVVLVYGREDASPIGPDGYRDEGAGTPPVLASDRLPSQGTGAAPRWEPGQWVHYHLRYEQGPLGKCSCGQDPETIVERTCVMPAPVAKFWFGDWDVVSYELQTRPGQALEDWLKRSWHRDRVAIENWGGWEMDFPPGVPIYDNRGAVNFRAMRKFGPPLVPHVVINRLDTMMRKLPNTAARPWEIFDWLGLCEKGPRMYFAGQNAPTKPGVMQVTESEFKDQIAQAVAAALAAERARPKKGAES